jgi:hypothetical protein
MKSVGRGFSTKRNGRRNEFSSRSYNWQGTAYFFFLAGFFAAAFLAGFFLAAIFLGAAFFLVAIDNPPFQSADAGRSKIWRVVDECHHSVACVLRNELVAYRQRIFSCTVGKFFVQRAAKMRNAFANSAS